MEARKEEEIKSTFEEAAASYKRLLTGSGKRCTDFFQLTLTLLLTVMASSSEAKRTRMAVPEITTAVKAPEPVVTETPKPVVTEKPSVETLPVCRTYMEANALLNRFVHVLYRNILFIYSHIYFGAEPALFRPVHWAEHPCGL